jgi:predicted transcriptional regulator
MDKLKDSDKAVLVVLQAQSSISIDEIAIRAYYSPRVVQQSLRRLELNNLIIRHSSRGRVPNQYEVLSHV